MSSLYFSKLPLPPANYNNNNNIICKPWHLPSLFEKSLSLQDHTSDRAYRHIAFEPKNKLTCNNTMHLKHELESVHGDIKAIHYNVGADRVAVMSFYNILDAKHCYHALKQRLSSYYEVYFVQPAYIRNNIQVKSTEKLFLVFSSINSRVDLLEYDYMKHILRFGSIYSLSESRISRSCILVHLEYHDERHGEALQANLNCSFIEGAQIMVYSATTDDEIACTSASGKDRPAALSIDTIRHVAPSSTATQKIMVATPLPSPVAEGESYFTVDTYHPMSSLPPSPVALQHEEETPRRRPKPNGAVIETSPSASSNTTFSTCPSKQDDSVVSYAAIVQSTPPPPPPPPQSNSNTTITPELTCSSSNPTPSPSPTRSAEETIQRQKVEDKVPTSASSRNNNSNSRSRKRPLQPSTKKPASNSVDFDRIRSGQDKRTTFMIRNIPNKYTQQMLMDYVNTTHERKYDFLYLRIDFQNKCNVGYAFINFIDPKKLFKSDKKCDLSYANIQGKQALMKKFQNSQVMSEDVAYQPKLFYSSGSRAGQEQPWPYSSNNHNSSSSHSHVKSSQAKDDIAKPNISVNYQHNTM